MNDPNTFAARLRARQRLLGYWVMCDNPLGIERVAGVGYDYVCADGQHGMVDQAGWRSALIAIDARGMSAGLVRVPSGDPALIAAALDLGARGVIVPLVNSAEEAAAIVSACRYPPVGERSYGPMRSGLRIGPGRAETDEAIACVAMIETLDALRELTAICATPGLDGVYVGPADLTISLGGQFPGDPAVADEFAQALATVANAAEAAGIACGIQCNDGETAAARLAEGFTFATVCCDLIQLEEAAAAQLALAQ
jgi:4-hydroxy-2-oxoheptanedioate aldolase